MALGLTLRARFIVTVAVLLAAVAAAPLLVLPGRLEARAEREVERRTTDVARAFAAASEAALDFDDDERAREVLRGLAGVEEAAYGLLLRADGSVLGRWGDAPAAPVDPGATPRTDGRRLHVRVPIRTLSGGRGALQVGLGLAALQRARWESWGLTAATAGVVFALGLAAAFVAFTALARPLREVTALATRIGRGDEAAARDLDVHGGGEAGEVASALAGVVDRLVAQRAMLVSQAEASSEAILTLGPTGQVLTFNRRLRQLWAPHEVQVDAAWADLRAGLEPRLTGPLPEWLSADAPAAPRGVGETVELTLRNGRFLELYVAPIREPAGAALGTGLFFRDVTQLREAEQRTRSLNVELEARVAQRTQQLGETNLELATRLEELRRTQDQLVMADRAITVGRLAAGVAHEINNPLSFVVGNLGFIQAELAELEAALQAARQPVGAAWAPRLAELRQAIRDAGQGSSRVARIVRDLKTTSRPTDETIGPVSLAQAADIALGLAANELRHRATVVREYAPAPTVDGDEGRVAQVFLNLVINAAHAIPAGQAERNLVTVAVGTTPEGWAFAEVRDTGRGIPADEVGRVFDPFFTTKPQGQGTGLGLAVSRGIVEGLGGRIEVRSSSGVGTTFRLVLPPGQLPPTEPPRPATAPPPAPERSRILLVDDEADVGVSVRRLLGREHEVVTLEDPHEALRRLSAGERFDLVLCDLMMPGMSGMALHAAVADASPEQARRFAFITGGTFTEEADTFVAQHADRILQKPLEPQVLRDFIHDFRPP